MFDDINDGDCNSGVVTISSLSVRDESDSVRDNDCHEYNATCYTNDSEADGNTTDAASANTSSTRSESIDSSMPCSEGSHSSSPTDVVVGPHQFPVQPVGDFPLRVYGSKKRSFNSKWYKRYPWLEYSKESDSVFCFRCCFCKRARKG